MPSLVVYLHVLVLSFVLLLGNHRCASRGTHFTCHRLRVGLSPDMCSPACRWGDEQKKNNPHINPPRHPSFRGDCLHAILRERPPQPTGSLPTSQVLVRL